MLPEARSRSWPDWAHPHLWRIELIAHLDHRAVSNGLTENLNLKIKNTKRIARGYRNFDDYRLRLLLSHGRIRDDHSPTRIRTRAPRFAAQRRNQGTVHFSSSVARRAAREASRACAARVRTTTLNTI